MAMQRTIELFPQQIASQFKLVVDISLGWITLDQANDGRTSPVTGSILEPVKPHVTTFLFDLLCAWQTPCRRKFFLNLSFCDTLSTP